MTTRIKLRRDTETNWDSANPVLALGEPGYDTTNNKIKIGDGVTVWSQLAYLTNNLPANIFGVLTNDGTGNLSWQPPTSGTLGIRPDIVTYQDSGTFYGKTNAGFTLVDGLNDDDNQWTIPLPNGKTVTFLGQTYDSEQIHLCSNSYIYFAPSNIDISEYYLVGPGQVPYPAVFIGSADFSLQKYYYGIADGTDTFVIGYEGSSDTGGTEGSPSVVWEFQFNLSGATATSFDIVFNNQQATFPAGAWGVSNGTDWVDMINPLPWGAYDRVSDQMNFFNVATIGPIDAPDITAATIAFTGPGVNTYETQDVTYINIDPFDGKINVGMDSSDTAVISARNYGLRLTTARANDDVVMQPGARGSSLVKGGHASANQQGTGGNAFLEGGNAYNTQGPSEGGYVYIRPGNGDNGGPEGQVLVQFDNHEWRFKPDGTLQLPNLDNDAYQPFYNLNGATLKLGGESDPYDQIIITGPEPTSQQPNAQRIVIQGQKGFGNQSVAGEGGDVYIWGGTGGEGQNPGLPGDGGDIKLRGGAGQAGGSGGYIRIEAGDTFYGPGGVGGFVEINAGDAVDGSNGDGGDITLRAGRGLYGGNNGEIYLRTGENSEFEWRFDNGGTLNLAGAGSIGISSGTMTVSTIGDITLGNSGGNWTFNANDGALHLPVGGDIVDSNGNSVLNNNIVIPNTVKGYYMLQGRRPNNSNDVLFQAVTTVGNYIYTVGKNEYALNTWEDSIPVVQKIERSTGTILWSKRIAAGRNAQFNFEIVSGIVNVIGIANAGVGYKAGEQLLIPGGSIGGSQPASNVYVQVDTVDVTGSITGCVVSQQPVTPGSDGTYNNVTVYDNNNNVQPHSIAYDLDGEQVIVACKTNRGAWSQEDNWGIAYIEIYCLDDTTGAVNQTYTLKDNADMEPTSIAVNNLGNIAVVGQKYNEYRSFGTLTILAPGNGYFDILKTNLDPEHYPNSSIPGDESYNFFIQGTGIAYQEGVDNVNYYQNVPTTVREGTDTVTIDVVCDGAGPYTYGAVTVQAGGTNYRVGHKIKYLGTQIGGGATPANDLILTVTGVDGSGTITTATASGTAPSGGVIIGLTNGTNYQVGSGAAVNINISPVNGGITSVGTGNFGDYHYVVGDVLTVAGTNFANGTSPANDIVLTVTDTYLGGPNGYTVTSGTVPSDALRIQVNGVDFTTGGGEWTMRQTLGGEAFIWTPTWNKAIGSSVDDWFNSVTFSPDGQSIYAVGKGNYEVNYSQALVVKFATSNGAIDWSKYVNSYLDIGNEVSAEAMSVVTQSNGNVIVAIGNQYNPNNGRNEHGLVCLNNSGTLQWAKTYQEPNDNFDDECKVLRNSDDDLFLVYRSYSGGQNDAWAVIKVNGDNGERVWGRALTNDSNGMYFNYNWGNDFAALGGSDIIIVGYTYIPNDNYYSGLLVKFPQDGFKTFDSQTYRFGQQFGDLTLYDLVTNTYAQTQAPSTFTPEVHTGAVTIATNEKAFATVTDVNHPRTYLQYFTRDDLGYVEFGDGSRQSFATDKIPQILGSYNQDIKLSPQDSGKHFFFDQNCGYANIIIPAYDLEDPYPVGYTVTIVNCSGVDVYVKMEIPDNGAYYYGSIWGSGRNIQTRYWGIPDSGSGSLVTLMKVKTAQYTGGENESGPIWIIAGPSDLYDNN